MKKVLFIGPIGGLYGRDIELNLVAQSLQNEFKISFFSTGIWLKNSVTTNSINNPEYSSLISKLLKKPMIALFCFLSWSINGFTSKFKECVFNKYNHWFLNVFKWDLKILDKQIRDKDIVFCFVQLESAYLTNIIEISKKNNCKVIIRPTGTINKKPSNIKILKKVDLYIHHSVSNKNKLDSFFKHNWKIIDQGSGLEDKLLKIKPIKNKNELSFGFLGRFNKNKGIKEIIKVSKELGFKLIIAGDDIKKLKIQSSINHNHKIKNLGVLNYEEIDDFFKLIDVFIINSVHETGPLTGLEAMCSSRFIISTRVGAMPKRLENNPNLWIEDNLKSTILELLNWPIDKIANIGKRNREIYINYYSIQRIKNQYLDAIKNISNA